MKRIIPKEAYSGFFNTHDSIEESMAYASAIINKVGDADRLIVMTAFQCLINTIIQEEDKNAERIAELKGQYGTPVPGNDQG